MLNQGWRLLFTALILALAFAAMTAQEQPSQKKEEQPKIPWQVGPTTGQLGDIAQINIPKGFRFTGKAGTQQLLVLTHNVPSGSELGAVVGDDEIDGQHRG